MIGHAWAPEGCLPEPEPGLRLGAAEPIDYTLSIGKVRAARISPAGDFAVDGNIPRQSLTRLFVRGRI